MAGIGIIETGFKQKNWDRFTRLPWEIYRDDPHWVPPLLFEQDKLLDPRKNPFFKNAEARYWLACRHNRSAGRIAAIIDHQHNAYHNDQTGFFGFFETQDHPELVSALFDEAMGWLRSRGMKKIIGPVNLSTAHECGLLVEGFQQPPFVQMTHNPGYYRPLLEQAGFSKEIDLLAFYTPAEINNEAGIMERLRRIAEHITRKERISFRTIRTDRFEDEIETIRVLFNDFMRDNWGFVPVQPDEFRFMTASLKQVLVKELAIFAEVDGRPVGFSVGLPDINQVLKKMNGRLFPLGLLKYFLYKSSISAFRVMLMGVSREFRKKGLEAVFIYRTIKEGVKKNFRGAELSWVAENNEALIRELNFLGSQPYKRYRIFAKPLV